MGVVSPVGMGVDAFWSAICAGECGIRPLTRFDVSSLAYRQGGEIAPCDLVSRKQEPAPCDLASQEREIDPATRFMLVAAAQAVGDGEPLPADTGVVLATNFGGVMSGEALLEELAGKGRADAGAVRELFFQNAADRVACHLGIGGPRMVLSLSCSSGSAAIAHGAELIRRGRARAVLVGGYDALSRFAWSGLSALRTMTKDVIRPFDKNRAGTIFSEGAGALLLESAESAVTRGAAAYAEVLGCAMNNNAHHMTAPAKRGAGSAAVMREAMRDAGLPLNAVDHINTHGTGTKYNDLTETEAIKDVFGEHAAKIAITSIKSTVGHMLGAAGAVEAIASVLSLRDSVIPPTIHYREPDPECDLDLVANTKREMPVDVVLSNSAGIGGCNAAVVFGKPRTGGACP